MKRLLEAGKVIPVIERGDPLREGVEAVRHVGEGHAKGKVVIRMETAQARAEFSPAWAVATKE